MAKQPVSTTSRRVPSRSVYPRGDVRRTSSEHHSNVTWDIPFGKTNLFIFIAGLAVIIIGYMLMATAIGGDPANNEGVWNNDNAVTVAPFLLTIGYCIVVPLALFFRNKRNQKAENQIPA